MNIKVTVGEEWNGLKWLRVIFNGGSFMLNSSNLDVLFSDINCFLLQFTYLLTYSVEQRSSREANGSTASQKLDDSLPRAQEPSTGHYQKDLSDSYAF